LNGKTKKKERVGRLGKSTHNVEILVTCIEIDTTNSWRNETQVSEKPLMQIVVGRKGPIMTVGCSRSKDVESIMGSK